jgi:hypothetical protein
MEGALLQADDKIEAVEVGALWQAYDSTVIATETCSCAGALYSLARDCSVLGLYSLARDCSVLGLYSLARDCSVLGLDVASKRS